MGVLYCTVLYICHTHTHTHHTVSVLGEPLQGQEGVVGLHDHVTHLILVGEHRIGLHQLLRIPGDQREREREREGEKERGKVTLQAKE